MLDIKNDDNLCALWCISAHLNPKYRDSAKQYRSNKPTAYEEHKDQINTGDLQFPLRIHDIAKLERLNNLNINVYSLDFKSHVIPIRISKQKEVPKERIIDLLYVEHELNTHYCLITNIAGLCRTQQSNVTDSRFFCRRCLHFCRREDSFKEHMERCKKHVPQKNILPKKNDIKGGDKVRCILNNNKKMLIG